MTIIFCLIVAGAFFIQSLIGFGGGLIAVPLLSLFMPVKDVVTTLILFQISMGLLVFKTHRDTNWSDVRKLIPAVVIGVMLGLASLHYIPANPMRLVLAGFIILYLLKTHTSFNLIKKLVDLGGVNLSGLLGGLMNAMIGGGAPAFVVYLKDRASNTAEFRANITAILFITNIPRVIGSVGTNMVNYDLTVLALTAYPGFLLALFLGQKFHGKIPKEVFSNFVTGILILSAVSLILKVFL